MLKLSRRLGRFTYSHHQSLVILIFVIQHNTKVYHNDHYYTINRKTPFTLNKFILLSFTCVFD